MLGVECRRRARTRDLCCVRSVSCAGAVLNSE
jgi:hypothetical protein